MSDVGLRGISKRYGGVPAVHELDLDIREGEFLTLLGPSGCGKTTMLRMIAGFVEPTSGRIHIGGEDVTALPPQRRGLGMVFQDYALFPHLTIGENIGFGLVERGVGREKILPRVRELLELIQLPHVERRYPGELSGGQQQRVALARAIAHPPRVLLMDEPLGALDLKMREAMQLELRRIQQELKITTLYVTHDQVEAMTMSDRIAVMSQGRIQQLDSPSRIYNAPATKFVANFIGKVNFLAGAVLQHGDGASMVRTGVGVIRCAPIPDAAPGEAITVSLRPEHLKRITDDTPATVQNVVEGRIEAHVFTGNLAHVTVRLVDGTCMVLEIKPSEHRGEPGERIRLGWHVNDAVVVREA